SFDREVRRDLLEESAKHRATKLLTPRRCVQSHQTVKAMAMASRVSTFCVLMFRLSGIRMGKTSLWNLWPLNSGAARGNIRDGHRQTAVDRDFSEQGLDCGYL